MDKNKSLLFPYPFGKWEDIVGEEIASSVQPVKLERGVLVFYAKDSVWKYHVEFYKDEIIKKLNDKAGQEVVKKIVVKVGDLQGIDNKVSVVSLLEKPRKKIKNTKKTKKPKFNLSQNSIAIIKTIKDPALKRLARKLLSYFPPESNH